MVRENVRKRKQKGKGENNNVAAPKSIYDSGWGIFLRNLQYKAESAGIVYGKVNADGTSQRCSGCDEPVKKSLAIRTHRCPKCGLEIDRDYNGSLNIKKLGLSNLLQELQEVTPHGD